MGSPSILMSSGWKFSSLKKGDKVTLIINPMKSGQAGGFLYTATLPDGRVLSNGHHVASHVMPTRKSISSLMCASGGAGTGAVTQATRFHGGVGSVPGRARRRSETRAGGCRSAGIEAGIRQTLRGAARGRGGSQSARRTTGQWQRPVHSLWRAHHDVGGNLSGRIHSDAAPGDHHFGSVQRGAPGLSRPPTSKTRRRAAGLLWPLSGALGGRRRWWWTRSASRRRCRATAACRTANRCASPSGSSWSRRIICTTGAIEDPVVLDKPVEYTLAYKRSPGYEMVEFVCDNNREYVDEKGVVRLRLKDR